MSKVELRDQVVVLNGYYQIELSRIPTHLALIEWIAHLAEKHWFDTAQARSFIYIVCQAKGWDVRGNIG